MEVVSLTVPPSVSGESISSLMAELDRAEETGRVVVLSGSDDLFCRGLDFDATLAAGGGAAAYAGVHAFADLLVRIMGLSRPTLAVVAGEAVGGGFGLASACDVVLAGERASFALPEALFGLTPATIMPVLLQRALPQKLRRLVLTGRRITAQEAFVLGLVDEVVPHDDLERRVRRWARELGRPATAAVALLKRNPVTFEEIRRGAAVTAERLSQPGVLASLAAFQRGEELPWGQ